jgi:hypothetical protein
MRRAARYPGRVRPTALGLFVLLIACGAPRKVVTALALVEDPTQHDGEALVLVGTVENPRLQVPPQGSSYTAFTLTDGTARVPVIAWGTQQIGMGDVVEVRGMFRTRLRAGNEVLLDTVEAKFVRIVRAAVQPPGTPVSPP